MIQPKRRITDLTTLNSTTTRLRARTQRAMLDMYNVRLIGAAEKTRTSTGVTPQRPQRCASTIPPQPHFEVSSGDLAPRREDVNPKYSTFLLGSHSFLYAFHLCAQKLGCKPRLPQRS